MIISNFLKFLLLFFVVYSPQQITVGMYNPPPDKEMYDPFKHVLEDNPSHVEMQNPPLGVEMYDPFKHVLEDNPSPNVEMQNPPSVFEIKQFSLTELSFLTLILNSIKINKLKTNEEDIKYIIRNNGNKILEEFNLKNDQFLLESINKIIELINKYEDNLQQYLNLFTSYINNRPRNQDVEFLSKRNKDKEIMNEKDYRKVNQDNVVKYYTTILNSLSKENFLKKLNELKNPTVQEKNLIIYYYLLAQTKILINLSLKYPDIYSNFEISETFAYKFLEQLIKRENYLYNFLKNLEIYNMKLFENKDFLQSSVQFISYLASFGNNNQEQEQNNKNKYFELIFKEPETSKHEGKSIQAGGSGHSGIKQHRGDKSKGKGPHH